MPAKGKLSEYQEKRSFERTPEPPPEAASDRKGPLLFSVQKHNATRLHYDLRLEYNGVLLSWAVPKGFSYEPSTKHIAIRTEDHPFDYASFEGVIPEGNYGAGEVIVWDCGTYWCDEHDAFTCEERQEMEKLVGQEIDKGKLSVFFRGHKLKGSWALVKLKDKDDWLLFKHNDEWAKKVEDVTQQTESVLTGLTIEDLERKIKVPRKYDADELAPGKKVENFPTKLEPMASSIADAPFNREGWIFEPKLDGIRCLAYIFENEVRLVSRRGLDMTKSFPEVAKHLKAQRVNRMILDGEIMAFGPDGRAHFHHMQQRMNLKDARDIARAEVDWPTVFYAFDILHFEGAETRSYPLNDRKRFLAQAVLPSSKVQVVTFVEEEGTTYYKAFIDAGFEGMIAKKADSKYELGKRSKCWLKIKPVDTAEFVVAGYSKGEGNRHDTFGSLVIAKWVDGDLIFAGQVGSGFNDHSLTQFKERLKGKDVKSHPFKEKPAVVGKVTWVEPEIVVEVKYNEETPGGLLRGPVFLGVREDVEPKKATGPAKPIHIHSEEEVPANEKGSGGAAEDSLIGSVLEQLDQKKANLTIELGEHTLNVTSLDKVFWPENKEMGLEPFTKRDLLRYLAKISPYMVTHTKDRPLTMIRFPEGIHGEKFFQKHWEQKKPEFVESVRLFSESNNHDQIYILANNMPTLLWLGQLGTLEFHVLGSRCTFGPDGEGLGTTFTGSAENIDSSLLNYPDFIKFDIDPYIYSGKEAKGEEPELHPEGFEVGKTVAFWLKDLLDSLNLDSYVKTTGKTGLHIFVPIVRNVDFDSVKSICETLCRTLEKEHPKIITTEWSVPKRTGKIFLDYNMNVRAKTLGSAYTPRALPNQSLGVPVTWQELPKVYPTQFTMRNVFDTLARRGDVWHDMLDHKKDLLKVFGA